MSALDEARDHYLARAAEHERSCANDPVWLVRLRAEATAAFGAGGLPTTRWEEWRYTNVASLARIPFERAGAADAAAVTREQVETLATPVFACSLFVFVDGHFAPGLSSPRALTGELRVESLAQARAESPGAPSTARRTPSPHSTRRSWTTGPCCAFPRAPTSRAPSTWSSCRSARTRPA